MRYPDNLRDAKLLQSALLQAQTIDLPPPRSANAKGEYIDLIGFSGEDTGLGAYDYLAFRAFGVNIPALTYLYFVIVTVSLVLYGIGHWRSVGAMAAVVAVAARALCGRLRRLREFPRFQRLLPRPRH